MYRMQRRLVFAAAILFAAASARAADFYFRPRMHGTYDAKSWENSGGMYLDTPQDKYDSVGNKLFRICDNYYGDGDGPHNFYFAEGTYDLSLGRNGAQYNALGVYSNAGGTVSTPTLFSGGWYTNALGEWLRDPTNHPPIIDCKNASRAFSCFVDNLVLDGFRFVNSKGVVYLSEKPEQENNSDVAGVLTIGSNITVRNCWFMNNQTNTVGVGRQIGVGQGSKQGTSGPRTDRSPAPDITVESCIFSNWTLRTEGYTTLFLNITNLTVRNCSFLDLDIGGGGNCLNIYVYNFTLEDSVIEGGVYRDYYGAIGEHGNPRIERCRIQNITGADAIKNISSDKSIEVVNCLITGNAQRGIHTHNGNIRIVNCTVVGNALGDVYAGYYDATCINCIVSNATDRGLAGKVKATYSMTYTGVAGDGNIAWHPTWEPGTYRLVAGSAGLNAGTTAGAPATDIEGLSRPQGKGIDMGCYELFVPSGTVLLIN
ncbi:MAG: right-handed parallel beta-helix repeat-containing protein [Kiritimatiellae bacterium]|nr:right-handed parallel beta-helix repeat-containing protein [Kiritimatiellia bacterium]